MSILLEMLENDDDDAENDSIYMFLFILMFLLGYFFINDHVGYRFVEWNFIYLFTS